MGILKVGVQTMSVQTMGATQTMDVQATGAPEDGSSRRGSHQLWAKHPAHRILSPSGHPQTLGMPIPQLWTPTFKTMTLILIGHPSSESWVWTLIDWDPNRCSDLVDVQFDETARAIVQKVGVQWMGVQWIGGSNGWKVGVQRWGSPERGQSYGRRDDASLGYGAHSLSMVPEPPMAAGKSPNFGSPSLMRKTVSP